MFWYRPILATRASEARFAWLESLHWGHVQEKPQTWRSSSRFSRGSRRSMSVKYVSNVGGMMWGYEYSQVMVISSPSAILVAAIVE